MQDGLIDAIAPDGSAHVYRPIEQSAEDAVARVALRDGHTVIINRTNRTCRHGEQWLQIAREAAAPAVAVVMTASAPLCRQRNRERDGRRLSQERMERMLAAQEPVGPDEGFRAIYTGDILPAQILLLLSKEGKETRMSIATRRGDRGQTGLPGGVRVSKTHPRVECYGTIDELISHLGLARALANDAEVNSWTRGIQRELFKVGSAIGTPPEAAKPACEITAGMVAALDREVERIEAIPGLLNDWSVPGELAGSAAFDVARTVCRKAERLAVGLHEAGELTNPHILEYLNRLSDVLWLIGRMLEVRAGADAALRPKDQPGARWSRAW
jgi:cob(I)alamin adenosyltransferase